MLQTTLKNPIEFCGIGLHSGDYITVNISPAGADEGIAFIRKDLEGAPRIQVDPRNVVATNYATTLGVGEAKVSTVEHILAAFFGMGISNAVIEIDGPEVPVMDGSSVLFVNLIKEAGIKQLQASRKYIKITKPIRVKDGDKFVKLYPLEDGNHNDDSLEIDYTIDFAHPVLTKQTFKGVFSKEMFTEDISSARTFCFLKDVEMLQKNGLAKGGSLENAVVIGEDDILNEEGLRHSNEFVRHKVLDLIGDLSILGLPIQGRIQAHRSGHAMNYSLVNKLIHNPGKWEIVDSMEESVKPSFDRDSVMVGELAAV